MDKIRKPKITIGGGRSGASTRGGNVVSLQEKKKKPSLRKLRRKNDPRKGGFQKEGGSRVKKDFTEKRNEKRNIGTRGIKTPVRGRKRGKVP